MLTETRLRFKAATRRRSPSLLLDEVAEVFEFHREVDVVDHDVVGDVEDDGREVKDAADAGVDKAIGDFLGGGGRDGNHRHADGVFVDDLFDFIHREDGDLRFVAAAGGIVVEGGDDFEAFLLEAAIREERRAEIADADQDDGLKTRRAEQVGDHFAELLDVVAKTARAELAEVGQVFAKLGRLHAGGFGKGFAGDGSNVI